MRDIFSVRDVSDLPEELRAQLLVSKQDEFTGKVVGLLEKAGRPLSLDEFVVGFYRVHNETKDRKYLMMRLYTMTKMVKPVIETVKGKKGVYKLK